MGDSMIVARVQVSGAQAFAVDKKTITSGMAGAQVQLEYTDPLWDSLHKTVVFYGAVVKDIITDDTIVTVPAEVIARPNVRLTIGVYGVDAEGCVVIPTLLADLGSVRVGANPSGDTSTNPTLPVWAQLQAMIGNLGDLDTTAKSSLVAAINEAMKTGGDDGGYYTPDVSQSDANTMNILFAASKEGMTAVPGKSITLPAGPQGEKGDAGPAGPQGPVGSDGLPGADGYTPVKGTDYFTDADKAELVDAVLAALPVWEGGSY